MSSLHVLFDPPSVILQTVQDFLLPPPFVSGSLCEVEVNECVSSPCLNEGVCVDEVNKFTCSCAAGFTGDLM